MSASENSLRTGKVTADTKKASTDPSALPSTKDLTIENITENVIAVNSQCKDARTKYVLERLVSHLHDFARETRLSTDEWMAGIQFLTRTGQICTDVRQEFILLSDIFGLSLLVDSIDHPKPPNSTEGTVLGPFHTHDAEHIEAGGDLSHDTDGEPLLCLCTVKDIDGRPIEGVTIDVWETDSHGFYDVQRPNRTEPDGRAVLKSGSEGGFWFNAIVPVRELFELTTFSPYPIPADGPVGGLLKILGRHEFRPSHIHFAFKKAGYDQLITALYLRGDPYENSDAVFGVKDSLVVDLGAVSDEQAEKYKVKSGCKLLTWDFVLVTDEVTRKLREKEARKAMEKLGLENMQIVNGLPLPVPSVD